MKLYFKYLKLHLKSQLQYKTSFALSFISQIFVFFTYYFIILSLFSKFNNIKGFTVYEVLLTFSIIQFGFAINEVFARGVDKFDSIIINGEYDRVLLRPRLVLLQILCFDIKYVKVSKIIQALIMLVIALINIDIVFNVSKVITLLLMLLSSVLLFFGIFLLSAAYCFITIQGLEVRNAVTYGGKEAAQYPIGIFKKGFAMFLTYVIPFAFVNYYPLLYITNRNTSIYYMFSPLVVFLFVIVSLICFKLCSKKYISTGS